MRFQTGQIASQEIKDTKGNLCPPDLVKKLRDAGVESISCRDGRVDWDVVREDLDQMVARRQGD